MPTEAQIEAAVVAFSNANEGSNFRDIIRAALTAAEEVRGQVSEEDAAMLKRVENWHASADPELDDGPSMDDFVRLLALARRGAGQAVPDCWVLVPKEPTDEVLKAINDACDYWVQEKFDAVDIYRTMLASAPKALVLDEAAIRADERERCAKIAENWMALFDPAIGPRLAASIRAAAPKPEDKP